MAISCPFPCKECAVEDLGGRASCITFISRDSWGKWPLLFWCLCWTLWGCVSLQACLCTNFQTVPIEIFFLFRIAFILNLHFLQFLTSYFFFFFKWWICFSVQNTAGNGPKSGIPLRFYHNRRICRLFGIKAIQINTYALHESNRDGKILNHPICHSWSHEFVPPCMCVYVCMRVHVCVSKWVRMFVAVPGQCQTY